MHPPQAKEGLKDGTSSKNLLQGKHRKCSGAPAEGAAATHRLHLNRNHDEVLVKWL